MTGLADPATAADETILAAADAAVCGAGTTAPSPTASEITAAGMTRQRSITLRAIVPAGIAHRPLNRDVSNPRTLLL
jgi:hypothetical protein